jgi:hypothetical protein
LSDELTFGEWKSEVPDGRVLAEVPKYTKEYDSNWEPETAKYPVVISFPGTELKMRDVVVGLEMNGPGRAYPWDTLVKQSPVVDRVNGTPLLVAVGPDGKSFRVFISRIDGKDTEFFLKGETEADTTAAANTATPVPAKPATPAETKPAAPTAAKAEVSPATKPAPAAVATPAAATPAAVAPKPWILLDTTTASEWNFQGCAVSGPSLGKCLDRIPALKDYWFDWRNYHPDTTLYKR